MAELLGIGIALICAYLGYALASYFRKKNLVSAAIKAKRTAVSDATLKFEDRLKEASKDSTKKWQDIISMPVGTLIIRLQERSVTCLDVLRAYQAKALEVTKELNCVTEFITEADDWAKQLDSLKVVKGPLHGVPFSVKDNVQIVGYDCTIGISKFLNQPHETDAALVEALKELGAIPFCKTNIPQTLLSFGCGNPVWGTCKNPHNKDRTPGGSSGGEGCLVAAGGSPFGLGSDIGGSVRAPAAFCGAYSLKPTADRLSYRGYQKSLKGCVGVEAIAGIIAPDIQTVILINKLLLQDGFNAKFDPKLPPIPWRESLFSTNRKLRIGYYDDDGFFPTTPGVKRSIQIARENLEKLGHELVPFQPISVDEAFRGYVRIINADGARYIKRICDGEALDRSIQTIYMGMVTPNFIKPFVKPLVGFFAPRLVPLLLSSGGNGISQTHQLWQQLLDQSDLKELLISSWKKLDLDLCIGPTFACPAPRTKDIGRLVAAGSYTIYYSYLNLPVGIVPVTKETQQDQAKLCEYADKDLLCKIVKKVGLITLITLIKLITLITLITVITLITRITLITPITLMISFRSTIYVEDLKVLFDSVITCYHLLSHNLNLLTRTCLKNYRGSCGNATFSTNNWTPIPRGIDFAWDGDTQFYFAVKFVQFQNLGYFQNGGGLIVLFLFDTATINQYTAP